MPVTSPGRALREIFEGPETYILPFGAIPMHAQMAELAGYEAFQLSGGMSAWWNGVSDTGWLTLTEVVDYARRTARSVDIPIYCDADTGYGAPINVQRTVSEFIDAGVGGIHIEDQREPKKSGGVAGVELVSDAEAIGRLNAAVAARDRLDEDFMIVARTDGYGAAGGGVDEAIRRGLLYKQETGADVIFYEGFHSWDQAELALKGTPGPAYAIGAPMIGRKTVAEMTAVGQAIHPVPFILPGVNEVWRMLRAMRDSGEAHVVAEYIDQMNAEPDYPGWGAKFGRPSTDYVRETEEKFLPETSQRDYDNTLHAGEKY